MSLDGWLGTQNLWILSWTYSSNEMAPLNCGLVPFESGCLEGHGRMLWWNDSRCEGTHRSHWKIGETYLIRYITCVRIFCLTQVQSINTDSTARRTRESTEAVTKQRRKSASLANYLAYQSTTFPDPAGSCSWMLICHRLSPTRGKFKPTSCLIHWLRPHSPCSDAPHK